MGRVSISRRLRLPSAWGWPACGSAPGFWAAAWRSGPGPGRGRKCVSNYLPMATGALKMIRVLLADDHDIVRAGLRRLVEDCGDMEVVAEAADGQRSEERRVG